MLTPRGQRLLEEVRGVEPARELAEATRLRREHPPRLVAAALAQALLRQRAAAKFGPEAGRMYFTRDGLEQATRAPVADWRAARLAARGARRVADLGCGIGGDALALARAGLDVLAVDRSALACAVAAANAEALGLSSRVTVRRAAAQEVDPRAEGCDAAFADPARRRGAGGGRVFDPEAYSPPLSWALGLAVRVPHTVLKTAPGLPHEVIPPQAEAEWVSHRGEVKEAVLWFGPEPPDAPRRATLLPGPHEGAPGPPTLAGNPRQAPDGPPGRYLYEPDGAVIRAGLVADVAEALEGRLLDPAIAYIAADRPRPTAFATGYEITDVLPFQLKRLRALLRERGVGTLTVKKRGSAVVPEELRARMRLSGPASCTVFLTRVAGAPTMLLGHPLAEGGAEGGA
ncbi:class I SAM-dependent methyltransferase [Streptomyces sp. DSM 44917]|uniref:Class I SAM-dependent methyltransferase n=1 Tax=Streptomyces boetiae TaxID=3075541 RepID=A0ABU2LAD5_9ACTN|nr:class I SAM-dependent methyltransferase [Streptomyces sp. DSM 44917]MDT0308539.1 class I SAM-dependent methyltransferase [Streptomyces sp. DSM 44917]